MSETHPLLQATRSYAIACGMPLCSRHPLRIALGSHRTVFYSHHDMLASRFTDDYIEANYLVRSVTGDLADGMSTQACPHSERPTS